MRHCTGWLEAALDGRPPPIAQTDGGPPSPDTQSPTAESGRRAAASDSIVGDTSAAVNLGPGAAVAQKSRAWSKAEAGKTTITKWLRR